MAGRITARQHHGVRIRLYLLACGLGEPGGSNVQRLGRQRVGQVLAVPLHGVHVTPCHQRSRASYERVQRARATCRARALPLQRPWRPRNRIHRMTLDQLRQQLNGLDRRLLELIAERQSTSREIARVKRATGYPTRDYGREREVILAVRAGAAELGVPADVAEAVMRVLIRSSLATQEQASVAARGAGSGQRALVI